MIGILQGCMGAAAVNRRFSAALRAADKLRVVRSTLSEGDFSELSSDQFVKISARRGAHMHGSNQRRRFQSAARIKPFFASGADGGVLRTDAGRVWVLLSSEQTTGEAAAG